jgi:hypothetical protein
MVYLFETHSHYGSLRLLLPWRIPSTQWRISFSPMSRVDILTFRAPQYPMHRFCIRFFFSPIFFVPQRKTSVAPQQLMFRVSAFLNFSISDLSILYQILFFADLLNTSRKSFYRPLVTYVSRLSLFEFFNIQSIDLYYSKISRNLLNSPSQCFSSLQTLPVPSLRISYFFRYLAICKSISNFFRNLLNSPSQVIFGYLTSHIRGLIGFPKFKCRIEVSVRSREIRQKASFL